jgi:hypothetical protein
MSAFWEYLATAKEPGKLNSERLLSLVDFKALDPGTAVAHVALHLTGGSSGGNGFGGRHRGQGGTGGGGGSSGRITTSNTSNTYIMQAGAHSGNLQFSRAPQKRWRCSTSDGAWICDVTDPGRKPSTKKDVDRVVPRLLVALVKHLTCKTCGLLVQRDGCQDCTANLLAKFKRLYADPLESVDFPDKIELLDRFPVLKYVPEAVDQILSWGIDPKGLASPVFTTKGYAMWRNGQGVVSFEPAQGGVRIGFCIKLPSGSYRIRSYSPEEVPGLEDLLACRAILLDDVGLLGAAGID